MTIANKNWATAFARVLGGNQEKNKKEKIVSVKNGLKIEENFDFD